MGSNDDDDIFSTFLQYIHISCGLSLLKNMQIQKKMHGDPARNPVSPSIPV